MFGRKETTHTTSEVRDVSTARGGISFGAIMTGVVVALGAMFLLSALVGGVLAGLGYLDDGQLSAGEVVEAGIGAGIALVVAQFLSYLWGGYTAGRMSRGAGAANGLLVPLFALILAALVGAIATGLGADANLNLPFSTNRLPLENDTLVDWGVGIGLASLVAMFLGGLLGGTMGARWHTKLEQSELEERHETHRDTVVGSRDDEAHTETYNRPAVAGRDDHSPDLPTRPADSPSTSSMSGEGTTTRTYRT